jgi:EmrB/QacA subfamily drug resistance transporter
MSPTAKTGHPRRWTILALVLAAECMDLLDGTIVNVAAPTIHDDLHAGTSALQWIIGGYALAFAVGLIAGGRLGDIYGRKRLFVLGALGFVAASVACAFAVSPEMLIGCRLAQGAAAALLIPQGLGIIREVFAPAEMGKAFTVFGPVIGLSAVLGPILGGALIAANAFGTGWRLIFFINLPLGVIAAVGAARLMPESRAARRPTLDLVGTALAGVGMGLLIYPLIQGRDAGWPAWTYLMLAASAACFGLLVVWTRRERRRGRDALVEPTIFKHPAYVTGLGMIVVLFSGMIGCLLVLTLFLQLAEHFSAIHAGLTLAPFALGLAAGATLAGAELVMGLGLGLIVSPLFDFILASVTDVEVGSASGVLNAVQQLAGAIGVAGIGTVFFTTLAHSGFVVALERSLLIELATTPILLLLCTTLPRRARESEAPETVAETDAAELVAA